MGIGISLKKNNTKFLHTFVFWAVRCDPGAWAAKTTTSIILSKCWIPPIHGYFMGENDLIDHQICFFVAPKSVPSTRLAKLPVLDPVPGLLLKRSKNQDENSQLWC